MGSYLIQNARIITPTGIAAGSLRTRGDIIAKLAFGSLPQQKEDVCIDADGAYLSPGFIDIHTHGAGGADFMDGDEESVYRACRTHLEHGTTSIVPTTITGTRQSLLDVVRLFKGIDQKRQGCPEILGLHLEGPYFSYEQRGAQDPQYLRSPDPGEYLEVLALNSRIVRWSFAVELEGAEVFLRCLRQRGIISSLAHSDATCAEIMRAYGNGLSALTHFYSGMSGVKRVNAYRVAGAIEAGYLLDDLYVEVIADGCHLPAELLQLIYKIKGAERICLVTDSMRAAGMPDGGYKLGNRQTGLDTVVEEGVAKLPDRTAFAGSVATTDRLVRTMKSLTDAPLYQVVNMITRTPARLLGIQDRKGALAEGMDADLLLFDEAVNIKLVMARGELVKQG